MTKLKPSIPRKRLWVWFAILSLLAVFLAAFFWPDELFRSRPPYGVDHILYANVSKSKPLIDMQIPVLGRIKYPGNAAPFEIKPEDLSPDAAGLIYAEDGISIDGWRMAGREFQTAIIRKSRTEERGIEIAETSRWEATFIPYAPAPDKRDAAINLSGQWIPVRLPYDPAKVAARNDLVFRSKFGVVQAMPEEQPSRITDFRVRLSIESDKPVLFVGEFHYTLYKYSMEAVFLLSRNPKVLSVDHTKPSLLDGELHSVVAVPIKCRSRRTKTGHIFEVLGNDGGYREPKAMEDLGFVAVQIGKRMLGPSRLGIPHFDLPQDKPIDAIGYRSTAKEPYSLALDANWK